MMRAVVPSHLVVRLAASRLPSAHRAKMRSVWIADLEALRWPQRLPYALGLLWRVDAFRAALATGGRRPVFGSTQAGLLLAGFAASAVTLGVVASLLPSDRHVFGQLDDGLRDAMLAETESERDPIVSDSQAHTGPDTEGILQSTRTLVSTVVPLPRRPAVESPGGIGTSAARRFLPEFLVRFNQSAPGGEAVDAEFAAIIDQLHAIGESLAAPPFAVGIDGRVGIWFDVTDDGEMFEVPTVVEFGYELPVTGVDDDGGLRVEPR